MDRCRVNSSYNWIDYSRMGRDLRSIFIIIIIIIIMLSARLNSQLKPALILILGKVSMRIVRDVSIRFS